MTRAQNIQELEGTAVVLYGKPRCVQCDATERKFKKHNIHFTKVNVAEDPAALDFITRPKEDGGLGYHQAPVVYVSTENGDVHWSGYDVYKIAEHITERADILG